MSKIVAKDLETSIEISPNINVLVGSNGSGKTRIIHKIHSMEKNKSFIIDGCDINYYEDFPKVLDELNKYFKKINKHLEIIDSNLYFKHLNQTLHISKLSFNEIYLINLFFEVAKHSITKETLLIDEIEKGLHLAWQEMMLDSLNVIAPDTQFFITTHSPSILMKGHFNKFINVKELQKFIA